jgi:hypothetical protein
LINQKNPGAHLSVSGAAYTAPGRWPLTHAPAARAPPRSAMCVAPHVLILCAPGLRSKARFLHLSAPISAPPLSPRSLRSASHHPPLFQEPSTAAGSHCCRLVHLRVVIGWGSARQACHRSKPTGRHPSRRSPPTKLRRPLLRTSAMSARAGPPPTSSPPS